MGTLIEDIRYGVRVLARSPGFTATAVAVLALGIAGNSAIFSIADSVLLRPLPYRDASRLVMVFEDASTYGFPKDTPAPGNFADWKARNQVFEDMAAISGGSFNLTGQGNPEEILGKTVTANLFSVLGVSPAIGRDFRPEDDVPGAPRVAILSRGLWLRRFGGDPRVLGKEIWLDNEKSTIVGVMPRGFQFPDREIEMWVPVRFTQQQLANHGNHHLEVVARLKPGISLKSANANLAAIARELEREHPDSNAKLGTYAVPLRQELAGELRPAILMLLAAVCFVLLIACANVANLLLARSAGRRRELAVRLTLGASRGRLVRQMLTESVLLAVSAGALGLLLSTWGTQFLAKLVPAGIAPPAGTGVDSRVVAFTFLLSVAAGILFGTIPALQTSQLRLAGALQQGGGRSGTASSGRRLRDVLVACEVALAIVLLAGAALMIRSFEALVHHDPGFRADHVLVVRTPLPRAKYGRFAPRTAFYTEVLDRVRAIPGVIAAGYTTWIPLTNWGGATWIRIEGHPDPAPGHLPIPNVRIISRDYIGALGMRLIDGRLLEERDGSGAPAVALIDQAMARSFWPGENPLGKRFRLAGNQPAPWITIVGIVADVHQAGLDAPARPEMYMPYQQQDFGYEPEYLAVRTAGDPMALAEAVREQVWSIDNQQPVAAAMPLEELVEEALAPRRMQASLLGSFAALALLLAALGIYGVLTFAVTQRTAEIGLRLALGAQPSDVLRMVVGHGLKLFGIGAAAGLAAALLLARYISHFLYGVSATDPSSFAGITILLAAVTCLACYVPARRAVRVDPMVALRYE
jgi:predicted permease